MYISVVHMLKSAAKRLAYRRWMSASFSHKGQVVKDVPPLYIKINLTRVQPSIV